SVVPTLAASVQSIAPSLAMDRLRLVAEILEESRALTRFETQLAITFAALALLLSAVGVYGLPSGEVTARWRELAARRALGASPRSTLWTVARPCALAIAGGLLLGLVGAVALTRTFASLLHGVSPTDLATFCAAPAVLVAVGVAAVGIGSLRVLAAEPAATLRGD